MKVYLGTKKEKEEYFQGVSVYSNEGVLLYSDASKMFENKELKFENILKAMLWGIKKVRKLVQQGKLPYESILFFMSSRTVYSWFEREKCPDEYTEVFYDVMMELTAMTVEVEIIYTEGTKVQYKSTEEKPKTFGELYM